MGSRRVRRRGGRPSRWTVAVAPELVWQVERDEPLEEAARRAGLGATTLWRWLAAGRAGDARYAALVAALERARRGSGLARLVRRNDRELVRLVRSLCRNVVPGIGRSDSSGTG